MDDGLQFSPALNSTSCVDVPSILIPSARLCWRILLSAEQFEEYSTLGHKLQVWTNIKDAQTWTELTFTKSLDNYDRQQVQACHNIDISFQPLTLPAFLDGSEGQLVLEATTPLSPILGRTLLFTYRLVNDSGYMHWFGSPSSNGEIQIAETCSHQEVTQLKWLPSQYDTLACSPVSTHDKQYSFDIDNEEVCFGWGISSNGKIYCSENMPDTLEMTDIVLLPRRKRDISLVAFCPLLYVSQGGYLSISRSKEGHRLHFSPNDLHLRAIPDTSKWQDEILARYRKFQANSDIQVDNADILVLFEIQPMPRFWFLPMQPFTVHASLDLSKIASFAGNLPVALIEPRSANLIFLSETTGTIHVEFGFSGGELVLAMVHTLASESNEWKVMFLPEDSETIVTSIPHYDGSPNRAATTVQESGAQSSIQAQYHSSVAGALLFSLALQFLQLLFQLLPSPRELKTDTPASQYSYDEVKSLLDSNKSSLFFKAIGKYKVLLHGQQDVTKVAISLNGLPLSIIPDNVGNGRWIYDIPGNCLGDNESHTHEISISV